MPGPRTLRPSEVDTDYQANLWARLGDLSVRRERPIEQWGYGAGIIAGVMRGGWTGRLWAEAARTMRRS